MDVALTPALELAIGEQGAGVPGSARDCSCSQARAQRDGGEEVAHLVSVVATIRCVAKAQVAEPVVSCNRRLQSEQSELRSTAKLWIQAHTSSGPKPPIISIVRRRKYAIMLRPDNFRLNRTCSEWT